MLKLVPERQVYRRIAQTFPVVAQLIITKKSVAIRLLDSLIIQMQDRFSDEDRHARHLLYLVPRGTGPSLAFHTIGIKGYYNIVQPPL